MALWTAVAVACRASFGGGPSQPEMTSFKSVNVNNMVNLFSGNFSYNIPLLDVGGYPVNLYYSGEIGVEQDASWVGLGWNINPGDITRNMRGVPDDFNGQETLTDTQDVKPNVTYGVSGGVDFEFGGQKTFGASLWGCHWGFRGTTTWVWRSISV